MKVTDLKENIDENGIDLNEWERISEGSVIQKGDMFLDSGKLKETTCVRDVVNSMPYYRLKQKFQIGDVVEFYNAPCDRTEQVVISDYCLDPSYIQYIDSEKKFAVIRVSHLKLIWRPRTIDSIEEKEVVHCPTEELAIKFLKLAKKYKDSHVYSTYKPCYFVNNNSFWRGSESFYKIEGYKITPVSEFIWEANQIQEENPPSKEIKTKDSQWGRLEYRLPKKDEWFVVKNSTELSLADFDFELTKYWVAVEIPELPIGYKWGKNGPEKRRVKDNEWFLSQIVSTPLYNNGTFNNEVRWIVEPIKSPEEKYSDESMSALWLPDLNGEKTLADHADSVCIPGAYVSSKESTANIPVTEFKLSKFDTDLNITKEMIEESRTKNILHPWVANELIEKSLSHFWSYNLGEPFSPTKSEKVIDKDTPSATINKTAVASYEAVMSKPLNKESIMKSFLMRSMLRMVAAPIMWAFVTPLRNTMKPASKLIQYGICYLTLGALVYGGYSVYQDPSMITDAMLNMLPFEVNWKETSNLAEVVE